MNLHVLRFSKPLAADIFGALLTRVSPERRDKISRFHHWQDAHRSLFSHLLLHAVAAQRLLVSPESLSFACDGYGKPFLASHADFHFNLSHSGTWVVCASGDSALGVDVERIKSQDSDLLESVLNAEERLALKACPSSEQTRQFFKYWTVKESFAKAMGLGLSLPFHSLAVRFAPDEIAKICQDMQAIDDWFFHILHLDAAHPLCLCTQSKGTPILNEWSVEKLLYFFIKKNQTTNGEIIRWT